MPKESAMVMSTEEMSNEKKKGFRVKSVKMRGQVSQGVPETLDEFPEIAAVVAPG